MYNSQQIDVFYKYTTINWDSMELKLHSTFRNFKQSLIFFSANFPLRKLKFHRHCHVTLFSRRGQTYHYGQNSLILSNIVELFLSSKSQMNKILYLRHYKPRLVHFLPNFSLQFIIKGG